MASSTEHASAGSGEGTDGTSSQARVGANDEVSNGCFYGVFMAISC